MDWWKWNYMECYTHIDQIHILRLLKTHSCGESDVETEKEELKDLISVRNN